MAPLPRSPFSYDYWSAGPPDHDLVELSCCMPTGVLIHLKISRNATLQEVKEDLWEEAVRFPLHGMLQDCSMYMFSCISAMAETDALTDENKRLCDVRPFCCILKVIEKQGDKADNKLNSQISHLIGKGLHEFEALKNTEVNDFRWKMKLLGDEVTLVRQRKGWLDRVRYQFPPRLARSAEIPLNVSSRLNEGNFVLVTKFEHNEITYKLNIPYTITPLALMIQILYKKSLTMNAKGENPNDYVLKVCGQEEYLVGDFPLGQFLYIQETLARDELPTVVTMKVQNVPVDIDNEYEIPGDLTRPRHASSTLTIRKKKHVSSWTILEPFQVTVSAVCRLNCDTHRSVEVGLQVGLFHGGKSLCEPQKTSERTVGQNGQCEWEEQLTFDLEVRNIPRMARLCLVIYEISKSPKGMRFRRIKDLNKELYINPLAWVNTAVYDYKNQLKTGPVTLYMWTYAEDSQTEDLLNPLGTVVSNPGVEHCTALTLCFHHYSKDSIMFPSNESMYQQSESHQRGYERSLKEPDGVITQSTLENLRLMADSDPLQDMHEQERKIVWENRLYCLRYIPTLLPRLLHCVEWNDHMEVAEVGYLVHLWPHLPAEKALELLDYAYADQAVRSYAVHCIQDVTDEELSLYLLQLVQALKHEAYLCCDLVEFLLRRALENQKIGHYLFWHLRSEMQVAAVSVRFGLILEAYCRGSQEHIPVLTKQIECLEKLRICSELCTSDRSRSKEKARAAMQEYLSEPHATDTISNVLNPLNPSFRCRKVKIDKCRVMDSKMRPLWIVLENTDSHGDDIYLILKNGDDLRQDMLALQMLRIMDRLWKQEGYDFRMNPYGCISLEHRVGMIEIVLDAETIANIQKEKGMFSATSAFKKGSLLGWLKDHNPTEGSLNKAIEEFTLSCAGYCVATYVLGVADRHSDNIMVKKSGQLFHIDFGHILGHFKEKFGFRRERVPFVLTHDFVNVINKGQTKKKSLEFQVFQKYCEKAFLILRKHGCLILSLFAMMISTGLPELSSEKDLNYLRDTLVLDLSEVDAEAHFRSKFDEALGNSWKTSLNWASHNWAKNNKQ